MGYVTKNNIEPR